MHSKLSGTLMSTVWSCFGTGNHNARASGAFLLISTTTCFIMLVERLYLSSTIEADKDGISLIAAACDKLSTGPCTVDELWPGKSYNLSS